MSVIDIKDARRRKRDKEIENHQRLAKEQGIGLLKENIRKSLENMDRLKRDRARDNNSVKRSYNLGVK